MATIDLPPNAPAHTSIRRREYLGFFAGNFGNVFFNSVLTSFLLIYLTDVVGIEAAAVGTLLLVARLWDLVVDPVAGYVVDHLAPIRGRRFAIYAAIGGVLTAATFIALFTVPTRVTDPLTAAWIIYLIYGVTFVAMDIPMNSLIPAITPDTGQRARLATVKGIGYMVSAIAVSALTVPVVAGFQDAQTGWEVWTISLGVLAVVLITIMAVLVREQVKPVSPERYSIRDTLRIAVGNRSLFVLTVAILLVGVSRTAEGTALIYFLTYEVGSPELFAVAAGTTLPGILVGTVLFPALGRRFGARWTMFASFMISSVAYLALGFTSDPAVVITVLALAAIGTGGTISQVFAVQAEITDDIEHTTGFRAEGIVASVVALGQKSAAGIGAAMVGYILSWYGYIANAEQTPEALAGIRTAFSWFPAVVGVVGALVMLLYPITLARREQTVTELAQRRAYLGR